MKRNLVTRRAGRRGSAIMEFAIIGPLLMVLMGGSMDFSRVFTTSMALNNAATAGVQFAALTPANFNNTSGMEGAALASQPGVTGMTAAATVFCVEPPAGDDGVEGGIVDCNTNPLARKYIKVVTSKDYNLLSTYLLLPSSMNLKGAATWRVQ